MEFNNLEKRQTEFRVWLGNNTSLANHTISNHVGAIKAILFLLKISITKAKRKQNPI